MWETDGPAHPRTAHITPIHHITLINHITLISHIALAVEDSASVVRAT